MRVAILSINTGQYAVFWKGFYESITVRFLKGVKKHFYVWTDSSDIQDSDDVTRIELQAQQWPYNTLHRYKYFLQKEAELASYDYVFFLNSNSFINKTIEPYMLGIGSEKELITAKHSWLCDSPESDMRKTTEWDPESNAYIPFYNYSYVWGAFVGGKGSAFVDMCKTIDRWTEEDLQKGIIPVWHDESFLNKYRFDNRERFFLLPKFFVVSQDQYLGRKEQKTKKRIVLREKNKWFKSIKDTFCTCYGGFGNQLWCMSNHLKSGKDMILNTYKSDHIKDFKKYFKNVIFTRNYVSPFVGVHINPENLIPKEQMLYYIKEVPTKKYDTIIHWRMGDYLTTEPFDKVVLTKEYVEAAIKRLGKDKGECVIVTDSPEKVRELTDIEVLDVDDDLETFWTIINANNIIMSPSSFSYWAAYLSDAENVVFPRYWAEDFGASKNDETSVNCGIDMLPPDSERYIVMDNLAMP